jgi:small subunit ribosomal protein S20
MAEEKKKTKRPTPLKRDSQNEKRRLINKSFKSSIRSTLRDFDEALASKDKTTVQKALSEVYSFMDKGTKRGLFKLNKANRTKARIAAKAASVVI